MAVFRRLNQFMKKYFPTLWKAAKVIGVLVLALLLAVFLASIGFNMYGSRELRAAATQAENRGVPLIMGQLLASRPGVSEASNAANYYEAAFSLTKARSLDYADEPVPLVGKLIYYPPAKVSPEEKATILDLRRVWESPAEPLPDYVLAATKAYVKEREDILALVHRAAAFPEACYHVDWWSDGPALWYCESLTRTQQLANLAAWVAAEEGRPDDAVARVRESLAMAVSLHEEPAWIAGDYMMGGLYMAVSTGLTRVAARTPIPNSDLEDLQADLDRAAASCTQLYAIRGDLVAELKTYAALGQGRVSLPGPHMVMNTVRQLFPADEARRPLGPLMAWFLRGYIRLNEAETIRTYAEVIDNCVDPSPAFLSNGTPALKATESKASYLFIALKVSPLIGFISRCEASRARVRAAAAAMAAMRFRNDTGKWPEDLSALVPKYLDKLPIDAFAGKPLIYSIREDGLLIYSAGKNGVDDGGKPWLIRPAQGETGDYDDAGFRVWK
jgi:hypothetical protein